MSIIAVTTATDIEVIRQQANRDKNDDLLGAAESLDYALRQRFVTLPVEITMPDPPDALIFFDNNPVLAVEVRRETWQRLRHVEAHATPWGEVDAQGRPVRGDLIELNLDLCSNEPARRDMHAPKGTRTGDFRAIKKLGEKLEGEGWTGGEMEAVTLTSLQIAVAEKQAKFNDYSASTGRVLLFLIADGLPGAWDGILSDADLKRQAEAICASSDFERVLLFRFGRGISELRSRT
jgi:hypothetical protein